MGRSQKWPDLRSPISKIRDIGFVGTGDLIIFLKFHNFPWNIVAVARLESYFVVGSLDLTWWPDLTWHWVEIFTKVAEKMGGKVCKTRRRCAPPFFRYPRKTWGGGGRSNAPPPAGRGVNVSTKMLFKEKSLLWLPKENKGRFWGRTSSKKFCLRSGQMGVGTGRAGKTFPFSSQ